MAAFTSKATGNWSSGGQTTWNEVGVPGSGDTVTINSTHNVTVDTNTTVGTSPNNGTTEVLKVGSATAGTLTVAANVTLTVKGNIGTYVNGSLISLGAGSQIVFDNSASGGSPVYRIEGWNVTAISCVGTSGNRCGISAIAGQAWRFDDTAGSPINFSAATFTYCTLTRLGASGTITGFIVYTAGSAALSNVIFSGCGSIYFSATATNVTFTADNCTWQSGAYNSGAGACKIEFTGARTTGTRYFKNCVFDDFVTYVSKGFTFFRNVFAGSGGIESALSASYDWDSFRENFFARTGNGIAGNGTYCPGPVDRNYVAISNGVGNPHFIAASALLGADCNVQQNIFESQSPDLIDSGDCVMIHPSATSGGKKVILSNNIVLPAVDGETSGQLLTIYANNTTPLTDCYRNTVNVNNTAALGYARGAFAFAEASNGAADQIQNLKSNIAYGTSAGQGFLGERVQGVVKDIITAANYNWRYNSSTGDNGRGYEDKAASGDLWTLGNAAAAGIDNNQGSGTLAFYDSTRNCAAWATARGYGATYAAAVTAIKADTSLIADLINYIFEGYRPGTSGCKAAAADGACVGAANWYDSTRVFTYFDTQETDLAAWL